MGKIIIFSLLGLIALIIGYCSLYNVTTERSYRMRLTLEMDTPDGVKSGSSVIEVKSFRIPHWLAFDQQGLSVDITGEAVFVDLDNKKNVILVLAHGVRINPSMLEYIAPRSFGLTNCYAGCGYDHEWTERLSHMKGKSADLNIADIPRLITLTDVAKPESANIIYATAVEFENVNGNSTPSQKITVNRVSDVLGEGYQLKRVWVEITDDPITHTIESQLPWLKNFKTVKVSLPPEFDSERKVALPKTYFKRDGL